MSEAGFGGQLQDVEELDFGASQPVIASLMRSVERHAEKLARRIRENFEIIAVCDELRRRVVQCEGCSVYSIEKGLLEPQLGVAIDSTFPPEGGVDMVVGSLVGVVAGYVVYRARDGWKRGKRGVHALSVIVEKQEETSKRASIYSKILERRLALELLEDAPEGSTVVLIDGEIVPYTLFFTRPSTRPKKRLDELVSRLLEVAREKRVILVGVVKRSYTTLLNAYAARCGKRLSLNDKAVYSIVLKPGEYAILGNYSEILPGYAATLERGARLSRIVEERLQARLEYGEVVVGYYKPSGVPQAWQAVKIEVYAPWLRDPLRYATSHLDTLTSPATGLPYPVDLVDELVRIEARALEVVRYRLVRLLRERLQEQGIPEIHAWTLTLHTNPEKRYLYMPRRPG